MLISALILAAVQVGNYFLYLWSGWLWLFLLLTLGVVVMAVLVVQFFRVPKRECKFEENDIMCPADGKVVVIEEIEETEYFKDKRIQISIFMSPLNVHVNRSPIHGKIAYYKYHPGKYLVAWHPKSSTENERTSIVVEKEGGPGIMMRQIAGAVARRIAFYKQEGDKVKSGDEVGFIRFGSRVDVFLPLDADIRVKIGDKTTGGETILAQLQ